MRKSILNIVTGIGYQIITMIIGFIVPRLFLLRYGSEVNGLLSSSSQFLSYLFIFEAGVGSATIQALFGFIGRRDTAGINGVMSATHRYYKKTGWYYLLSTTVLALVYPALLNTSIPSFVVSSIVLFSGISGALSFFTFGKFTLLLNAENKLYVINFVNVLTAVVSGALRIVLINQSVSIIILQTTSILLLLVQVYIYRTYCKKYYAWLDVSVPPDNESISQKNAALLHQVSTLVFSNTDMILITFFLGLKSVSVYAIYGLVFNSTNALITNIYSGVRSRLGQIFSSDIERYKSIYGIFETLYTAIAFALNLTAYAMVLPFIRLYTGGINDINYVNPVLPILFVLLQLLLAARRPIFDSVYFAGHIRSTQWHTVIEAIVNISVSLLLAKALGMYGILIGSAVALVFRSLLMFRFVAIHELNINIWKSVKLQLFNFALFAFSAWVFLILSPKFNTFFEVLFGIVLCVIGFTGFFVAVNIVFNRKIFRDYRSKLKCVQQWVG